MNIDEHFCKAAGFLGTAQAKFDYQDYESAKAAIVEANSHTLELLDHIHKLIALQADIELSPEGS